LENIKSLGSGFFLFQLNSCAAGLAAVDAPAVAAAGLAALAAGFVAAVLLTVAGAAEVDSILAFFC
jgi:hypothetical protein